jgi:hypothetical protein
MILTLALFFAVQAASQELPKPPRQALCRFSDGSTITVTYSYQRNRYLFATDGSLVTVNGVRVPAGDYALSPAKGNDNNWTLTMRKRILKGGEWVLPPLPMSVARSVSPVGDFPVSFDQTGGSCKMYWRQRSNIQVLMGNHSSFVNSETVLSLEFTKENADLPVAD